VHRNAVDGVIMGGLGHPELLDDLNKMDKRGLPVVTLHDKQLDPAFANVGMDQVEVGRRATAHLIERGCRHIAHFGRNSTIYSTEQARYEGYCLALREAGLAYRAELVIGSGDYSYEAGLEAVQKLIESGVVFDGIVGRSDHHCAAALNVLVARGRQVPQQVKLIGIDNAPFCQYATVPLSSVSQEFLSRGRQALRLLMQQLREQNVTSVQVDPVVYARTSSALP
jgi:LacI family transcriptional regulator